MLIRDARLASNAPRTRRELLTFGGVAFELLVDDRSGFSLSPEVRRHCLPADDSRAVARAVCAVHVDRALPQPVPWRGGESRWTRGEGDDRRGPALVVRANSVHARVEPLEPGRYAVSAGIGAGPGLDGCLSMLGGVSAAIVHREGGLVLRATAVQVAGRAVLFIGPSGAGKRTAVALADAPMRLAHERFALVPSAQGWLVFSLPSASANETPSGRGAVYPLAAILRVRQGDASSTPSYAPLGEEDALSALRESVQWADDSRDAEQVYRHTAMQLVAQVGVGNIDTVLGRSLSTVLRTLPTPRAPNADRSALANA
jgi:hypothetical protein